MSDAKETPRRASILEATSEVFLRYGSRKTSMDDLARASGLSRQGLYLHFKTKEELLQAAVAYVIAGVEAACRAALTQTDRPAIDRLLGAFDAFHGRRIAQPRAQDIGEVSEAESGLIGALYREHERRFVTAIEGVLSEPGTAHLVGRTGVSPREIAETLLALSFGLKGRVTTAVEYRDRMATALRLVLADAQTGDVAARRAASNFPT
jgi:AcrR family transcriptional regulator